MWAGAFPFWGHRISGVEYIKRKMERFWMESA